MMYVFVDAGKSFGLSYEPISLWTEKGEKRLGFGYEYTNVLLPWNAQVFITVYDNFDVGKSICESFGSQAFSV